jgi:hypothetical protein
VPRGQMSAMARGWLPYARRHGLQAYMIDECRTSSVCPVSLDDIVMNSIKNPNGRRVWAISVCLNDDCMKDNHPCECEDGTCPPGTCPLIIPHPKCFNRDDLSASNMLFIVLFYLHFFELPIMFYPFAIRTAQDQPKTLQEQLDRIKERSSSASGTRAGSGRGPQLAGREENGNRTESIEKPMGFLELGDFGNQGIYDTDSDYEFEDDVGIYDTDSDYEFEDDSVDAYYVN